MSAPVDVFGVLDLVAYGAETLEAIEIANGNREIADHYAEHVTACRSARAAMSDLIAAASEILRIETTQGVTCEETEAAIQKLDTALYRVRGES